MGEKKDTPVEGVNFVVPLEALAQGRARSRPANPDEYPCTLPATLQDCISKGELEFKLRILGTDYLRRRGSITFRSKQEMDRILYEVYRRGGDHEKLVYNYLVEQGIIGRAGRR